MASKNDAERQQAIDYLINDYGLKPGDRIYTICRSVARSGMSATYSVHKIIDDPQRGPYMSWLTFNVSKATGHSLTSDRDAIRMHGCGYDRAYQIVYDLSRALFGDGYALKHEAL